MNADNKKIWVDGKSVEVTDEVYDAYMKGDRKIRYFEIDLKTERMHIKGCDRIAVVPSREDSLDRLMDDQAYQFSDDSEGVEEFVLRKVSYETLYEALDKLSKDEQTFVFAMFFENKTEREFAALMGITQPAIHKRKIKILDKLKNFLKNSI